MKKIFTFTIISCLVFAFYSGSAQTVVFSSDFENWTGNVPNNWVGAKTTLEADSISPYTISAHSPTQSCKLVNAQSSHKRFTTQAVSLTLNTVYYVSFWVRGHGNIRLGLYDGRSSGSGYATYHPYLNINSTSWAQYTDTITCLNTTSVGEFIFSVQYTVADLDHLQIDDVSITDGPPTTNPLISITYPSENATLYSAALDVEFNVVNFVVGNPGPGIDGHIHYTVDGGALAMHYTTNPINITGLTTGSHTVITQLVDTNHTPLVPNVADTVHFFIDLNFPNVLTIHDIQYTTNTNGNSPWLDSMVTTSGIVTAVASAGYFIQDASGAWNGIYVYDNAHNPAEGDSITIIGTVNEYYNLTEIASIVGYNLNSSGNTLPAITTVTASDVNTEQYEGVLVKIVDAICTALPNTYGEWQVYDGDTCNINDLMYPYIPVMGNHYDITGVIDYSFGNFFIEPRYASDVQLHVGINELEQTNYTIYPNPVKDILYLANSEAIQMIRISDIEGRIIEDVEIDKNNIQVNVSNLSSGTYFLSVFDKNGMYQVKKFIKN